CGISLVICDKIFLDETGGVAPYRNFIKKSRVFTRGRERGVTKEILAIVLLQESNRIWLYEQSCQILYRKPISRHAHPPATLGR
ncbi:hypothetical protein, partial [Pantoea sp. GbtcB22]|uniref:hypothetical protein n=1 Tax=Pantoea sp. GbtcB22 TaxID=2824767 RepID=UPI001C2F1420